MRPLTGSATVIDEAAAAPAAGGVAVADTTGNQLCFFQLNFRLTFLFSWMA
jgi:hypothetical protein